jgi:hypothetical protein
MDKKTVWIGKKELPLGVAYNTGLETLIAKNRKI